jgi:hypothetical protein
MEEIYMKQNLCISLAIIFALFYASVPFVNALDIGSEEYIIQKGDTLWDISSDKLEDYFLWPKLWGVNPQIKNPDLIFPGTKIMIPSKEELMRMFPKPEKEIRAVTKPVVTEVAKAMPKKYMMDKELYILSGWISEDFPSIGRIHSAADIRTMVGKNEIVYLKAPSYTRNGDKFLVIRKVKKVKHPKTGASLGYLIKIPGAVEVIAIENDIPKAKIISSYEEIRIGDGLFPYEDIEPPRVPDTVRTPDIQGYIVESYKTIKLTSAGDIIFLDKGQNDGLRVGDMFSVISNIPAKTPVGTLQIVDIKPELSKAVLLKTGQEVTIGDPWGKK